MANASLAASMRHIALIVVAYQIISISLVFVNKVLMDKKTSIEAPIFITWFQCVLTVAICWVCGELGARASPNSFFKQFPRVQFKTDVARKLLPLSLVFVGMITFNNLCLKYVEVSFYNVARSLTIVFNVIFTYFMLGETTSRTVIATLSVVVAGFFVGSKGEVNFSLIGTLFGVLSSSFVSLNAIFTKKVMPIVDGNQWVVAAYNNINASVMFLPIIMLTDEINILSENLQLLKSGYFWMLMVVGGIFGFLIGIVTIMQIKATSPLTHNISGTAKACIQTILALFLWGNETNFTNLLGVALVLFGSMWYSYVRTREMESMVSNKSAAPVKDAPPADSASISASSAEDRVSLDKDPEYGSSAASASSNNGPSGEENVEVVLGEEEEVSETAPLRRNFTSRA